MPLITIFSNQSNISLNRRMNKAIIFVLFLQLLRARAWVLDDNARSCATLFNEGDHNGSSLAIENMMIIPDLSVVPIINVMGTPHDQDTRKSEHWKNKAMSIQVEDGCTINVCSETSLEGDCMTFKNNITALPKVWTKKIVSAGCVCEQSECSKPKCGSIQLKSKECGRAFIESGCATCKNIFLTLKKGDNTYLGGSFDKKIKSFIVKTGCNLTVFEDKDFDSENEIFFDAGNYEDSKPVIGSYKCYCENETTTNGTEGNAKKMNNFEKPVELLDVPLTYDGVIELEKNHTRHKGLLASLRSLRNKRSSRNAYILVVGMTGSGKSATINFLFDNVTVAKVGHVKSTTKAIHEYRIPVPLEELGIKNSELVILDTPGLGDTEGLESDAKFLATLEDFLSKHKDLHNKIPNIVLIFGKFGDNRVGGKASNFVKTLRGIDLLKEKLFDGRFSNAIFVFTHFMGVKKSLTRNPMSKIQAFRDTIEQYTLLPKPISYCVAENEPVEAELPMVNGFYQLPNGDYYPQNLFKRIQEVTNGGGDPIGEAIIRNAFKHPEDMKIAETVTQLVTVNSNRVDHFFNILDRAGIDSSITEVSNLTQMAYQSYPKEFQDSDMKNALSLLQRSLNVRNIFTLSDVPKSTVDILKLLKGVRKTNVTMSILDDALGIKTPEMATPILVGNCYDLLKDSVLDISPFDHGAKKTSDIGYLIPESLTLKMINKRKQIFFVYDTKDEYHQARLVNLAVSGDKINSNMLYGPLRTGFNILPDNHTGDFKLTALRENRLFKVVLNDNPPLKQEFLDEIQKIDKFNQTDHENVAAWKSFFSKYGTHVVQSAFGGGAFEVRFQNVRNQNETVNVTKVRESMGKLLKFLFRFVNDLYIGKSAEADMVPSAEDVKYKLGFIGGDYNLAAPDFSKFDVREIVECLTDWDESLRYQPKMLQSQMTLMPLSQILRKQYPQYSDKIATAAKEFLNATLIHIPPPPPTPPPPREYAKKEIAEITDSFNEQLEKLTKKVDSERSNFTTLFTKLMKQLDDERLLFLQKIQTQREDTLKDVALTCFYQMKYLKGTKVCGALAHSCVSYRMATGALSVNSNNACTEIFNGHGCTGTKYQVTSNDTSNTDLPFTVKPNAWFSGQICGFKDPNPCNQPADLIIILDSSGSINIRDYTTAKTFVSKLVSALSIHPNSRVGFIIYGTELSTIFRLDNTLTPTQISNAISSAVHLNSGTDTAKAITEAVSQFSRYSQSAVRKNLVLLTDGYSNVRSATIAAANTSKSKGIRSFAVGIGSSIHDGELLAIAGGVSQHVFNAKSFDDLVNIMTPLSNSVCSAIEI